MTKGEAVWSTRLYPGSGCGRTKAWSAGSPYLHLWLPCPRNEQGLATLREWLRTGELEWRCRKYL